MVKIQSRSHSFEQSYFPPPCPSLWLVFPVDEHERNWISSSDFVPWPPLLSFSPPQFFAFPTP